MRKPYQGVGAFEHEWRHPPAPFNPDFDPKAKGRYEAVTKSMEADNFYSGHTREECAAEWRLRYDAAKQRDDAAGARAADHAGTSN